MPGTPLGLLLLQPVVAVYRRRSRFKSEDCANSGSSTVMSTRPLSQPHAMGAVLRRHLPQPKLVPETPNVVTEVTASDCLAFRPANRFEPLAARCP